MKDELRIAVCRAIGWTYEKAGSRVVEPLLWMELVCGYCKAVVTKTTRFRWDEHDHCGPGGGTCGGGQWTLFQGVWIHNGQVKPLPELSLDLMHELENGLTDDEYRQWLNHLIESRNKDCIPLCRCHSATAEQRAQAWVKLKGKGEK